MKYLIKCFGIFVFFYTVFSCNDRIDKRDFYTKTSLTVIEYLQSNPETTLFAKILERSCSGKNGTASVASMLGTYEKYTVFAPTNEAVTIFLDSVYGRGQYNIDTISQAIANEIALNSVIHIRENEEVLRQYDLTEGYQDKFTLGREYLFVQFGNYGNGVIAKINNRSKIIKENLVTDNGIVHIIDRVIPHGITYVSGLISHAENLKIFNRLLVMTSWNDSLRMYEDYKYLDSVYFAHKLEFNTSSLLPRYRRYGFTVFTETDDVFQADWNTPALDFDSVSGSVRNMDEIVAIIKKHCQELYPNATDDDYTSMNNAVNQFISYHIIKIKRKYSMLANTINRYGWNEKMREKYYPYGFIITPLEKNIDSWSYFQTIGKPNRLMKLTFSEKNQELYINRHGYYDNSFFGTYQETSCDNEGVQVFSTNGDNNNYAPNGYYFPIKHILYYDDYVKHTVLNERIRYNIIDNLTELNSQDWFGEKIEENLGISRYTNYNGPKIGMNMYVPIGYCENLTTDGSITVSQNTSAAQYLLQGIYMTPFQSCERIAIKLMSVPYAGIWEVRLNNIDGYYTAWLGTEKEVSKMKYLGVFDNRFKYKNFTPPYELNLPSQQNPTGELLLEHSYDSMFLIENDHIMRNHDMMYAPNGFGTYQGNAYIYRGARFRYNSFRYIIYRGYLEPDKTYYIRLEEKTHSQPGTWWKPNFIELVPKSVFDNPKRVEDYW